MAHTVLGMAAPPEEIPAPSVETPAKKSRNTDLEGDEPVSLSAMYHLLLDMSRKLDQLTSQHSQTKEDIQVNKADISKCAKRLDEMEPKVSELEDALQRSATLEKRVVALEEALTDQENRGRRNNIRIFGVPEEVERTTPEEFLTVWLPKVLDLTFSPPLDVQRAHRVPSKRQMVQGKGPRPFVAYLLRYTQVKQILDAARKKGPIDFKGHKIFIAPDYAKATAKLRKRFLDLRPRMRALDIRFGLLHPARMLITHAEKHLEFTDPEALLAYLDSLDPSTMSAMDTAPSQPSEEVSTAEEGQRTKKWTQLFKESSKRAFQPPRERRRQRSPRLHRQTNSNDDLAIREIDLRSPIK